MQQIIQPSSVSGTIAAPTSKSAMQRACAAALIRKGTTILHNPGTSNDDKAALSIIEALGAQVKYTGDTIEILSDGVNPSSNAIHCGESGLSVRMFTPIAALSKKEIVIDGEGSLRKRPLHFFEEVLPQLAVSCTGDSGLLPLKIQGPLQPKNITVDGSLSSQFLTGLLVAYSAAKASNVTITVNNLNSKPYIDLTLEVMKSFGLKTPQHNNYKEFYFGNETVTFEPEPLNFYVEGDWSGAAFLLVAGAVAGKVIVEGLDVFSTQADKAILQALMQSGAIMSVEEKQITIQKTALQPFHFNAIDCPDLFPPLVALAAVCNGKTVIEGVHRLTHKESNRAETLQQEFGKLGVKIFLQNDLMIIEGGVQIKSAKVFSHHDHRIAMACAVAALNADGPVTIEGAEAVNKSYPQFWEHLQQLTSLRQ